MFRRITELRAKAKQFTRYNWLLAKCTQLFTCSDATLICYSHPLNHKPEPSICCVFTRKSGSPFAVHIQRTKVSLNTHFTQEANSVQKERKQTEQKQINCLFVLILFASKLSQLSMLLPYPTEAASLQHYGPNPTNLLYW